MDNRTRLFFSLILIVSLVVIGISGYSIIEGWTFVESLYMTFITLTTVGFSEIRPLSDAGRIFTVFYLVLGLGTAGFGISTVVGYVFEGSMVQAMRERKMELFRRKISKHYIVCGFGDVAHEVVAEFHRHKVPCVVIDKNPESAKHMPDDSFVFITGDASDEAVLEKAKISEATGLVAALPDDAGNLFVVLTARQMNEKLQIVARATDDKSAKKILKAGANRVVTPDQIAGRRMASSVLRPQVVNFLDVAVESGNLSMRIEEYQITESSPLIDKTLRDTNIGQVTGAVIFAIVGPNGDTRYNPANGMNLASVVIQEKDVLIAMGSEQQLMQLEELVGKKGRR